MSGPYVIGCDVGSQGTNAALYAADGRLVASVYEGYDVAFPHPTWAEQDPRVWTAALHATIARLVEEVPEGPSAVKGLSFGSQLDGMVVCGAEGQPLRPAMIWMDRRAEAQAAGLAVDYSNASSLALLDPRTRTWSAPVLEAAGIDPAMLPELAPGTQPVGSVTRAFAEATGLSPGTVVAMGCGDEMAATLGAGVFAPGEVCDVVGTAEPVCAASPGPREDPTMLVECHPHADPDVWLLENPGFVSGGGLRWWRDQFSPLERDAEARGEGDAYDLVTGPAADVSPGAEGLVFLPCMQGAMAPEWNGAARGVFYGLTLAHTRAHMTRALLEGSAYALRDILEAMRNAGLEVRRLTIVGGGAKGALWRQSGRACIRVWRRPWKRSSPIGRRSTFPTRSVTRSTPTPTAGTATSTSRSSLCSSGADLARSASPRMSPASRQAGWQGRVVWLVTAASQGASQFSISRSGTRLKWRVLPVTTTSSRERAIEAMRRSGSSRRLPCASSCARSGP